MADAVLHFVFPSDFSRMREVHTQILSAARSRHYDEDSIFAINLSLEEGLINAVKHGNKLDPNKTVTVDASVGETTFSVTICDQGPGFDRKKIPDPTAEENLDKPSGRGILLIETYMTEVHYTKSGRCLHMTWRKPK